MRGNFDSGHGLEGVLTIRDLPDVDRLRALVPTTKHAVVIGGGYIGLEVAAQLRAWNIDVTLVEAQDRLLARVTSPPVSDYYAALHRDRGVRILLQSQAEQLVGENGKMTTVRLSDGTLLPADLVIVGIGLVPNVGPIAAAGGQVDNGIVVDEYCQTSLPHVFAIGDLARHRNEYAGGEYIRLESVQKRSSRLRSSPTPSWVTVDPTRRCPGPGPISTTSNSRRWVY